MMSQVRLNASKKHNKSPCHEGLSRYNGRGEKYCLLDHWGGRQKTLTGKCQGDSILIVVVSVLNDFLSLNCDFHSQFIVIHDNTSIDDNYSKFSATFPIRVETGWWANSGHRRYSSEFHRSVSSLRITIILTLNGSLWRPTDFSAPVILYIFGAFVTLDRPFTY